jgi:putative endonuclease
MPISPIGEQGETLVAHYLQTQHHKILATRWACRLGEIDLVSLAPDRTIALVEVKTRAAANWDIDGLLALTPTKQRKLWKTAECLIAAHPQWVNRAYRFDVALVRHSFHPPRADSLLTQSHEGQYYSLHTYIPNAFSG